jgi:hypothetical protein
MTAEETLMTKSLRVVAWRRMVVGLAVAAVTLGGCGSGKSGGGTTGTGGKGSGGTTTPGGSGGTFLGNGGAGGLGSGGITSGGTGGEASGGAGGTGGQGAGGVDAASTSPGGSGGNPTGGTATGGIGGIAGKGGAGGIDVGGRGGGGAGGTGLDAGVCPSGQIWCPGCAPGTGSCGQVCPGVACSGLDGGPIDALMSLDTAVSCGQLNTQEACDQRTDCHSVSSDSNTCDCATLGCCLRFNHCDDGGAVACDGRVTCSIVTPACRAPYVVQYQNGCFNGCVLATKCATTTTCPPTAPSDGAGCGSTALSCAYQDCAGAGRTQATCQGGTWSVQTTACLRCSGSGTYTGYLYCSPDQICVHTTGGGGAYTVTPSCMTNTCAPAPLADDCLGLPGLRNSCYVSGSGVSCSEPSLCGSGMGGCQ